LLQISYGGREEKRWAWPIGNFCEGTYIKLIVEKLKVLGQIVISVWVVFLIYAKTTFFCFYD